MKKRTIDAASLAIGVRAEAAAEAEARVEKRMMQAMAKGQIPTANVSGMMSTMMTSLNARKGQIPSATVSEAARLAAEAGRAAAHTGAKAISREELEGMLRDGRGGPCCRARWQGHVAR